MARNTGFKRLGEHPASRPAVRRRRAAPAPPPPPLDPTPSPVVDDPLDDPPMLGHSALPGANPYDAAVATGAIDYSTAKVREEVNLVNERMAQAKIATETARLELEAKRLEVAKERDQLIARSDYLARQESLVVGFLELARLTISHMGNKVMSTDRDSAITDATERMRAGMAALSEAVATRATRDVSLLAMTDAFRGAE